MKIFVKRFVNKVYGSTREILSNVPFVLVRLGHRYNIPLLTATGWRLGLYRKKKLKSKYWTRKKLIILAKSGGVQDIEAAYEVDKPNYAVFFMQRELLKITCRYYLDRNVSDLHYYTNDPEVEKAKIEYRNFLTRVVHTFDRLFGLDAILQFNIVFYAERELAAACSNLGIPFIANYKEALRSKAAWEQVPEDLKKSIKKFEGWKIAVYNKESRDALIKSQIIEPWQVQITGCARMDYSHELRNNSQNLDKTTILYYMIVPVAGLTLLYDNEELEKYNWSDMVGTINSSLLKLAHNHPKLSFIAKGKTGFSHNQFKDSNGVIPNNFKIIRDGIGHNLLISADVVIGFNTTAILEAVAAGIPVVVPQIFSENEKKISKYALEVCDAVYCVETIDEFEKTILKLSMNKKKNHRLSESQKELLDRMMGNPDGESGMRLKSFIDSALRSKNKLSEV